MVPEEDLALTPKPLKKVGAEAKLVTFKLVKVALVPVTFVRIRPEITAVVALKKVDVV